MTAGADLRSGRSRSSGSSSPVQPYLVEYKPKNPDDLRKAMDSEVDKVRGIFDMDVSTINQSRRLSVRRDSGGEEGGRVSSS